MIPLTALAHLDPASRNRLIDFVTTHEMAADGSGATPHQLLAHALLDLVAWLNDPDAEEEQLADAIQQACAAADAMPCTAANYALGAKPTQSIAHQAATQPRTYELTMSLTTEAIWVAGWLLGHDENTRQAA